MRIKIVLLGFMALLLVAGCTTVGEKKSSATSFENPVYGLLEENKGEYRISKFSIVRPRTTLEPWVDLSTRTPLWDTTVVKRCGRGYLKDRNHDVPNCKKLNGNMKLFYYNDFDEVDAVIRVLISPFFLGLTLTGTSYTHQFDNESFKGALTEAMEGNFSVRTGEESSIEILNRYLPLMKSIPARNNLVVIVKEYSSTGLSVIDAGNIDIPEYPSQSQSLNILASNVKKYVDYYNYNKETLRLMADSNMKHEQEKKLASYKEAYDKAKSKNIIESYTSFIEIYKSWDPKGLVSKSIKSREKLIKAEYRKNYEAARTENEYARFIDKYGKYDPLGYVKKSRIKVKKLAAARISKENALLRDRISDFRSTLSSGQTTNCGLVIEVKSKIVHIQSMIGPTWIKKTELYPPNLTGCNFNNGVYQPPRNFPI